jgi:hypothetical protein
VGEKGRCYCEVCIHVRSSISQQGPVSFLVGRYYTRTTWLSFCLKSGSIRLPLSFHPQKAAPLCQKPFLFITELAVNYNKRNLWWASKKICILLAPWHRTFQNFHFHKGNLLPRLSAIVSRINIKDIKSVRTAKKCIHVRESRCTFGARRSSDRAVYCVQKDVTKTRHVNIWGFHVRCVQIGISLQRTSVASDEGGARYLRNIGSYKSHTE